MSNNIVQLSDFTYRAAQLPETVDAGCSHGNWTNSELAQLYRIETALLQARIPVLTERGVTDEDDPWFSFIRQDGQVVVHIARYDGQYHLVSPALPRTLTGSSFADLTKHFAQEVPAMAIRSSSAAKGESNPVVLFTLLVAAIFFALDQIAGGEAVAQPLDERQAMQPQSDSAAGPPPIAPRSEEAPQRLTPARVAEVWSNPSNVQAWSLMIAVVLGAAIGSVSDATAAEDRDRGGLVAVGETEDTKANSDPGYQDRVAGEPESGQGASSLREGDEATGRGGELPLDHSYSAASGTGQAGRANDHAVVDAHGRLGSFQLRSDVWQTDKQEAAAAVLSALMPLHVVLDDGRTVFIRGDVGTILVTVTGSGGSIDVSDAEGLGWLRVQGLGSLQVLNMPVGPTPAIEISAGSEVALTVVFEDAVNRPSGPTVTNLRLDGGASVGLTLQKINGEISDAPISLSVASTGLSANTLSMVSTGTNVATHLKLLGHQDLLLQQTAASFARNMVDASLFAGILTLGIDLGVASAKFFSVAEGNIISSPNSSIGLINVASSVELSLAVDLQKLLIAGSAQQADSATSVKLSLGGDDGVDIGILAASNAQHVEIISWGDANTINALDTPNLSSLVLSGEAALSIRIASRSDASTAFEVDAGAMSGNLSFSFGNSAISSSRVTITGGAGNDVLSVASLGGPVVLSGGGGLNRFEVKQGSTQTIITDLKATDTVVVGKGSSAISTIINATSLPAAMQAAIDESASLTAAAAVAFALPQMQGLNGAVLFNYVGGTYVGFDTGASNFFDAGQDTVIQLTGIPADSSLNSIFLVA